jgi:hypothetical protein
MALASMVLQTLMPASYAWSYFESPGDRVEWNKPSVKTDAYETVPDLGFIGARIQLLLNVARVFTRLGCWEDIEQGASKGTREYSAYVRPVHLLSTIIQIHPQQQPLALVRRRQYHLGAFHTLTRHT